MKASELGSWLGFDVVVRGREDSELHSGYTSDLLSDVMANAGDASVLVTIQAHKNTVAVASLAGIRALVICNDRTIPDDMAEAAKGEGIWVFSTCSSQFEVSGLLYAVIAGGAEVSAAFRDAFREANRDARGDARGDA